MKVLSTLMALLCAYASYAQVEVVTHFNFETEESSAQFLHFGSNMEGKMTTPVANPHPTALNQSKLVLPIVKGSDSEVWGGAFLNPDLEQPLDATYVRKICMKVMFVLPGNLALKLESDPFDDPENWIDMMEVSKAEEWVELCFDLDKPSIEGNRSYPYGKVYDRLVFYPDFGKEGNGQDGSIYFIDDITIHYDWSGIRKQVSFGVDMNEYEHPFETVYVSGNFNGWSGNAFPLADEDGDGVYTGTTTIAIGQIEYKYSVDGWVDQEVLHKYGECTKTTLMSDGDAYVNRKAIILEDTNLDAMAWGSCYSVGQGVDITWSVNMSEEVVSEEGVYLAGGCCFGHGEYRLWDNHDDIYQLTIERQKGFSGHYTFTNGTCIPGWSCKENLEEEDCGDPSSYHDRYLDPASENVTMSHCFGQCGDDGFCDPKAQPTLVTFLVDMTDVEVDEEGVRISGTFSGWSDMLMENVSSNEYAITLELEAGLHQWKFKNGSSVWENFADGEPCTMSTVAESGGMYINRFVHLEEDIAVLDLEKICFNYCESCETLVSDVEDTEEVSSGYKVYPTISDRSFVISFSENTERKINLYSADGILVRQVNNLNELEINLDVSDVAIGLYFIQVITESGMSATKVMVSR